MQRPKPIQGFKKFVHRRKPAIVEVVREPTAGGIVFRKQKGQTEILLIQDAKDRWTIPKGHIEPGETPDVAAAREILEETGLKGSLDLIENLGKINFRYRRANSLVLMTTEIFLVEAHGDTDNLEAEDWMNGIKWFSVKEALDKIEYEDIGKLILVGLGKLRKLGK